VGAGAGAGDGDLSQATRKIIISQVIIGFAIQMRKGNADSSRLELGFFEIVLVVAVVGAVSFL